MGWAAPTCHCQWAMNMKREKMWWNTLSRINLHRQLLRNPSESTWFPVKVIRAPSIMNQMFLKLIRVIRPWPNETSSWTWSPVGELQKGHEKAPADLRMKQGCRACLHLRVVCLETKSTQKSSTTSFSTEQKSVCFSSNMPVPSVSKCLSQNYQAALKTLLQSMIFSECQEIVLETTIVPLLEALIHIQLNPTQSLSFLFGRHWKLFMGAECIEAPFNCGYIDTYW